MTPSRWCQICVVIGLVVCAAVIIVANQPVPQPRSVSRPQPPQAGAPVIEIATYNINWGNSDLPGVIRTIREADASIVCLQETNPESESAIRQSLSEVYSHMAFTDHVGPLAAQGFGILSKSDQLRITGHSWLPPRHGLFGAVLLRVSPTSSADNEISVAIVHLSPYHARGDRSITANLRSLARTQEIHELEIRQILSEIEAFGGSRPSVIVGDFNSMPNFVVPGILREAGYEDAFAVTNDAPDEHPTWSWPIGQHRLEARIDYIWVRRAADRDPDFKILNSSLVDSDASDHKLLRARLRLNESRQTERDNEKSR